MDSVRSIALTTTVALVAGSVGYSLADPLVALALTVVYGVGGWLTAGYYGAIPNRDDWAVAKYTGTWVFVATFAGSAVMNNTFDRPPGLGFSLALLVYGVAWTGYVTAVAQLTEADRLESDPAGEQTESPS